MGAHEVICPVAFAYAAHARLSLTLLESHDSVVMQEPRYVYHNSCSYHGIFRFWVAQTCMVECWRSGASWRMQLQLMPSCCGLFMVSQHRRMALAASIRWLGIIVFLNFVRNVFIKGLAVTASASHQTSQRLSGSAQRSMPLPVVNSFTLIGSYLLKIQVVQHPRRRLGVHLYAAVPH